MSFKIILDQIRCSKEMEDNIVNWHNTKIKNQEQRIVGEKKEVRKSVIISLVKCPEYGKSAIIVATN